MTTTQYKTIYLKDFDNYSSEWNIKTTFEESGYKMYCERSDLPVELCENKECAELKTHKTRPKVSGVEKAIIYKKEQTVVP